MIKGFWKRIKEGLNIILIGIAVIILWTSIVTIINTLCISCGGFP